MMWQRFRETIEAEGGQLRLNSEVVRSRHDKGRIVSVLCHKDDKTEEILNGYVLSETFEKCSVLFKFKEGEILTTGIH